MGLKKITTSNHIPFMEKDVVERETCLFFSAARAENLPVDQTKLSHPEPPLFLLCWLIKTSGAF
jgi:hypothetical protein